MGQRGPLNGIRPRRALRPSGENDEKDAVSYAWILLPCFENRRTERYQEFESLSLLSKSERFGAHRPQALEPDWQRSGNPALAPEAKQRDPERWHRATPGGTR